MQHSMWLRPAKRVERSAKQEKLYLCCLCVSKISLVVRNCVFVSTQSSNKFTGEVNAVGVPWHWLASGRWTRHNLDDRMDLFTVDSWTSDRDTDDLNSRLFGKNKAPRRGTFETSRKKVRVVFVCDAKLEYFSNRVHSHCVLAKLVCFNRTSFSLQPSNATARKQDRTVLGEQTGRNQKRKRRLSEDTTNSTGGQQATQELKRKKRPLASSSRKSEAQETPLGESCVATNEESTGKAGKGVLKRKRKKSSKKNKYKHLDEMHRLQNESVSGPSKLDIDSSVKVNANCLKSKVKEPENSDPAAVTAPDLFSCPKAKRIKSGKQKMPQKSDSSHKRKKSSSVENEADRVNKQKVNNPNEDNYENNKSEKGHKSPKKTSFDTHSLKAALNKEQPTLSDVSTKSKKKVVSLREKMEEKLTAARFRFLNQQLYTISGGEASCLIWLTILALILLRNTATNIQECF